MRKDYCWGKSCLKVAPALLVLGMTGSLAMASLNNVSIDVLESGPAGSSTFVVEIEGPLLSEHLLRAPSGLILDEGSPTRDSDRGLWSLPFQSLDAAFGFLEGRWDLVVAESPFGFPDPFGVPDPTAPATEQFVIENPSGAVLDRSDTRLLSPSRDAVVQNGEPFLLAWEFGPDAGDRTQTVVDIVAQTPQRRFSPRAIVSTPNPNGSVRISGFSSNGGSRFTRGIRNEPGASTNRWLVTASLEGESVQLPADLEVTLSTLTPLSDFVFSRGSQNFFGFEADLSYRRVGDSVSLALSAVPEPSGCLLAVLATLIAPRGRRRSE